MRTLRCVHHDVGNNGADHRVAANIGAGFQATTAFDCQPAYGDIDDTLVNLPHGWTPQVDNLAEPQPQALILSGAGRRRQRCRPNGNKRGRCFCADTLIETPDDPRVALSRQRQAVAAATAARHSGVRPACCGSDGVPPVGLVAASGSDTLEHCAAHIRLSRDCHRQWRRDRVCRCRCLRR